jgi:hypothetical protein
MTATPEQLEELTKNLTDSGKLIEAGWVSLRAMILPPDTPQIQVDEMRKAFMAGAQHLFSSIMTVLDPEDEPTDADLERMDKISAELRAYGEELEREIVAMPDDKPEPVPAPTPERLGDAPIQPEYHDKMQALAGALDQMFNGKTKGPARQTGFVLMVFPFGDAEGGRTNYISNGADRRDVVTLMREMIARFEGQPEMKGNA